MLTKMGGHILEDRALEVRGTGHNSITHNAS